MVHQWCQVHADDWGFAQGWTHSQTWCAETGAGYRAEAGGPYRVEVGPGNVAILMLAVLALRRNAYLTTGIVVFLQLRGYRGCGRVG